jgi:hypothetical protein
VPKPDERTLAGFGVYAQLVRGRQGLAILDSIREELPLTFSRDEAADFFHVHPHTIDRWRRDDLLEGFKTPSGRRLYTRREILMLAAHGVTLAAIVLVGVWAGLMLGAKLGLEPARTAVRWLSEPIIVHVCAKPGKHRQRHYRRDRLYALPASADLFAAPSPLALATLSGEPTQTARSAELLAHVISGRGRSPPL